ncbi:MAG: DUF1638 domain-containing protein, partial [Candidatus Marinimicrobia bacterium]|nr:DUF1638 domain-containing protein [Candidatus Neomarinimicrobiota bacterium]
KHYSNMAFIDTGLDSQHNYQKKAMAKAEIKNWSFDVLKGSKKLLQQLINGDWPESEFLVVKPGSKVEQSVGEDLMTAVPLIF